MRGRCGLDIFGKLKSEAVRFKRDIEAGKPRIERGKLQVIKNPGPGPEVRIVSMFKKLQFKAIFLSKKYEKY